MNNESTLLAGGMTMLALATSALVVIPYLQLKDIKPTEGIKPYTAQQLRGREVYIANGCIYCHSQQPRDSRFAPDDKRGWGRVSVAGDYYYDNPHLLGTMRTGPDLMNIGVRQPSADWHLGHLYQPRAYVGGSIMPSYPYLFDVKDAAEAGDKPITLPPGYAPPNKVVVPKAEALDLVAYLQSLNRTGAVLPAADGAVDGAASGGTERATDVVANVAAHVATNRATNGAAGAR
ncbi:MULTISPECIES: cbb3-type cytochrome c oxidase subunit II [unclassified Cupriavidus]|uniref:cbb3-type cytochrome c oxidase subunit II n=1 Tax=Cupriavidus sp. H19C3 TaxID=3241603 RepID=UPI003BF84450